MEATWRGRLRKRFRKRTLIKQLKVPRAEGGDSKVQPLHVQCPELKNGVAITLLGIYRN
jgi:hypothetical protein